MSDKRKVAPIVTPPGGFGEPPTFGKSLTEIFRITGIKNDFSEFAKSPEEKRQFVDSRGTFSEMDKTKKKGVVTVKE